MQSLSLCSIWLIQKSVRGRSRHSASWTGSFLLALFSRFLSQAAIMAAPCRRVETVAKISQSVSAERPADLKAHGTTASLVVYPGSSYPAPAVNQSAESAEEQPLLPPVPSAVAVCRRRPSSLAG